MTQTDPRRYRWTAIYSDGTQFEEPEEDVSANDPLRPAQNDIDRERCAAIVMIGPNPAPVGGLMDRLRHAPTTAWAVDLRDGHFEHDGVKFFDSAARSLRLRGGREFYIGRRVQQDIIKRASVGEDGKVQERVTLGERRSWQQLGWTGTDETGNEIGAIIEFE